MADDRKDESGESTGKGTDDTSPNASKPASDGPQEVADAAAQEAEYPEDETGEG